MSGRYLCVAVLLFLVAVPLYGQYALEFDGVDDYVEVPHDEVFEFTDQITVEIWFLVNSIPSGNENVFGKDYGGWATFGIFFKYGDLLGGFAGNSPGA